MTKQVFYADYAWTEMIAALFPTSSYEQIQTTVAGTVRDNCQFQFLSVHVAFEQISVSSMDPFPISCLSNFQVNG